ncbi:endonuclease NucS domain-containing protein [Acidocella sp.]|uniref:endonuclease NucS domain-containing protein n=1 Tax=Acidocella sp. TaxID=50710 RepID=UPI00261D9728|nr:endonuclease NucS domain-containing protein [Acidocella sp.]
MIQRHIVVLPQDNGGFEVQPLKEYLRQNPDVLPDFDPSSSTSHQLRAALKRKGWTMQETPSEIRLIKPGAASDLAKVEEVFGVGEEDDFESAETSEAAFTLESQLRDFLAANLEKVKVPEKRLRLYVDPTGRDGIEFPTAVGPIDILALDQNGDFVVFELKRANSPDRAVGQLARYMGWVQQTIGRERMVSGVIVAKTISQNLRYAVSVVPNVSLFEYQVEFHLRAAHEIATA